MVRRSANCFIQVIARLGITKYQDKFRIKDYKEQLVQIKLKLQINLTKFNSIHF